MDLGIEGRTAIVSGGSAGMGLETARALARAGVTLFVSARGAPRLEGACAQLRSEGTGKVTPIVADHSTAEGRQAILAACPAPDMLVISSSPPPATADFQTITVEQWDDALRGGLVGPVEMMKAVAPGMCERRFGRIVSISTVAAKSPLIFRALSGPPRAALMNYMVALSKRLASKHVTVNAVLPGLFHTDGGRESLAKLAKENGATFDEQVAASIKHFQVPAKRLGDPVDVGAFCAMLCSQYAGYITGQAIVIDGGITTSTF